MPVMPEFPSHDLVVRDAEFSAIIFENEFANVPLGILWQFGVHFKPVHYCDQEVGCYLQHEWIQIPGLKDWRQLDNVTIEMGAEEADGSFYTFDHEPLVSSRIRLSDRQADTFRLEWSAVSKASVMKLEDPKPVVRVAVDTRARLTGLFLHTSLLESSHDRPGLAANLASRFVDLGAFGSYREFVNEFGGLQCHFPPQ